MYKIHAHDAGTGMLWGYKRERERERERERRVSEEGVLSSARCIRAYNN